MYIYTKKNQLCYKNNLYFGLSNISPQILYNSASPFFYICIALFVNPFFRGVRSIVGGVDYTFSAQIQIIIIFSLISFGISFALGQLLPALDQRYNFTQRVFASKSFYHFICKGLAIENFLRSPGNWFLGGVFFCLYLILLFWVLFYSYSLSFKDMPFVYICRVLGYILCVNISLYIKCRSSIISHYTLRLKNTEKITRWSICRVLCSYRPIEDRPILKNSKTPNKVYTNCTLLFEKKGMAGYIEGLYNFRSHVTRFLLGFASTLLGYCTFKFFYDSVDGFGGMRRDVLLTLKFRIETHQEFLARKEPPQYFRQMVCGEMVSECQSLQERLDLYAGFKDPFFKKEEIEKRLAAYFEKEKLDYNKSLSIFEKVEKDLSDKSIVYFLFPSNYNRLEKLYNFCRSHHDFMKLAAGIEEVWKS